MIAATFADSLGNLGTLATGAGLLALAGSVAGWVGSLARRPKSPAVVVVVGRRRKRKRVA